MTIAASGNLGVRNLVKLLNLASGGLLTLAFLIAGGAFSLPLSGLDPHAPVGADSASIRSQIAIGVAMLTLMLFGASAGRRMFALLKADALILAMPALAILSMTWAPEPAVAVRRALAFAATVLGGFAVAAYRPGAAALNFVARACACATALSVLYVAVSPGYGVHQISDGVQSVHAGDWRGLFIHRTVLGQLSALTLALAVYSEPETFGRTWVRLGVIAAAAVCLAMAHSGGGLASASILLATPPMVEGVRRLARRGWLLAAAVGVMGLLLAGLAAPLLAAPLLHLFGKDVTLTGRTDLWRLMLQAAGERPLLGYGYSTGFRQEVARLVAARSAYGYVPNAQNGYLDVVLNLGLVGLGLTSATLGLGLWRATRLAPATASPLLICVFILEMNLVEATLISASDIFMLIYVTALVASGEIIRTRRRSDPPPTHAPR
jgi:O-antigen ligase